MLLKSQQSAEQPLQQQQTVLSTKFLQISSVASPSTFNSDADGSTISEKLFSNYSGIHVYVKVWYVIYSS
jgi:hypothetical protein